MDDATLHISIRHSGQRHTAHGAEERPRGGGISETGPDWGATLVHACFRLRARVPSTPSSFTAGHARMHCRRLR